jgi:hypothetical protein
MPNDLSRGFHVTVLDSRDPDTQAPPAQLTKMVLDHAATAFRLERELDQYFVLQVTRPRTGLLIARPVTDDPDIANPWANGWIHRGVREIATEHAARAVYTVAEAWVSADVGYSALHKSQPRFDPNRREVVIVVVENPAQRPPIQMWRAPIERNKGRPHLREWENPGDYSVREGRYTYLLPPEAYGRVGDA